jgi:hypothetical protein
VESSTAIESRSSAVIPAGARREAVTSAPRKGR